MDKRDNYRFPWFCSVMVHEMGHVGGVEHARDAYDIMNGPGEIYWRKCLTGKQAKRFQRRGKIIDDSIAQWTKVGRLSASTLAHPSRHGHEDEHEVAELLRSGEIEAHPIITLPVR